MLLDIGFAIGGLIVLILAADRLVVAATRLSRTLGVSTVLIGAVVVGFGTSIPEFVVTIIAALRGELDLAMSNVVSSNTANVTLVLGAAAVVATIAARQSVVRREGYVMMGAVVALAVVLAGGVVLRIEGFILLAFLVAALVLLITWARRPKVPHQTVEENDAVPHGRRVWAEASLAIVALAATIVAAQFLLEGVLGVGQALGWSAVFLGLITGIGTSLPELAAALASARKGESDLTLGNVLGSNVFNSLGVAGVAAVLAPGELTSLGVGMLVAMVGVALIAGLFAVTGQRIVRWEGIVLMTAFLVYAVVAF